jgi:hypothetical protein
MRGVMKQQKTFQVFERGTHHPYTWKVGTSDPPLRAGCATLASGCPGPTYFFETLSVTLVTLSEMLTNRLAVSVFLLKLSVAVSSVIPELSA